MGTINTDSEQFARIVELEQCATADDCRAEMRTFRADMYAEINAQTWRKIAFMFVFAGLLLAGRHFA